MADHPGDLRLNIISFHFIYSSYISQLASFYIAYPALFNCLGSPAASNVPFPSLLSAWAVVLPGATKAILAPMLSMNAVVSLLYPSTCWKALAYSKYTVLGDS